MLDFSFSLEVYTVSFFGHRYVDHFRIIEDQLEALIIKLLCEHEYVAFLVGRNGEFDQIVSSAIKRVKRNYRNDNCSHILVLPYNLSEIQSNEDDFYAYYDEIVVCPESRAAHFKSAIQIRNRKMIDRSDLCVFYVNQKSGGAYQSLRYAIKSNKTTINLASV